MPSNKAGDVIVEIRAKMDQLDQDLKTAEKKVEASAQRIERKSGIGSNIATIGKGLLIAKGVDLIVSHTLENITSIVQQVQKLNGPASEFRNTFERARAEVELVASAFDLIGLGGSLRAVGDLYAELTGVAEVEREINRLLSEQARLRDDIHKKALRNVKAQLETVRSQERAAIINETDPFERARLRFEQAKAEARFERSTNISAGTSPTDAEDLFQARIREAEAKRSATIKDENDKIQKERDRAAMNAARAAAQEGEDTARIQSEIAQASLRLLEDNLAAEEEAIRESFRRRMAGASDDQKRMLEILRELEIQEAREAFADRNRAGPTDIRSVISDVQTASGSFKFGQPKDNQIQKEIEKETKKGNRSLDSIDKGTATTNEILQRIETGITSPQTSTLAFT